MVRMNDIVCKSNVDTYLCPSTPVKWVLQNGNGDGESTLSVQSKENADIEWEVVEDTSTVSSEGDSEGGGSGSEEDERATGGR